VCRVCDRRRRRVYSLAISLDQPPRSVSYSFFRAESERISRPSVVLFALHLIGSPGQRQALFRPHVSDKRFRAAFSS
jgi:hypothetical protein